VTEIALDVASPLSNFINTFRRQGGLLSAALSQGCAGGAVALAAQ